MAKGTLQIEYEKLVLENLDLQEQIKELEAENKKMKELKCPPIESGDSCICPIEELETILINKDEQIKELEQEIRLLRIVIAEALEECIGDDIEKATIILEQKS